MVRSLSQDVTFCPPLKANTPPESLGQFPHLPPSPLPGLTPAQEFKPHSSFFKKLNLIFLLKWVDLQCCVNFCCTANWFGVTHTHIYVYACVCVYIHTHTFLFIFFSIMVYFRIQDTEYTLLCYTMGPCLSILHILVSSANPKLPVHPSPSPLSPWQPQVCFLSVSLFCRWAHLCPSLNSTSKWCHMVFVFLFLLILSVYQFPCALDSLMLTGINVNSLVLIGMTSDLHIFVWKWSEVAQFCPTLCNPVDSSLPGSAVHRIFQARILEWAAISFSRGIFPTQGLNPGLLHCRQTLYRLSHQGSIFVVYLSPKVAVTKNPVSGECWSRFLLQ